MLNRNVRRIATHIVYFFFDAGMASLGFILAYWIRYEWQLGPTVQEANYLPFNRFIWIGLTLVAILMMLLETRGLYRLSRGTSWLEMISRVAGSTTLAVAAVIVILFATRTFYTRLLYVYAWFTIVLCIGLGRALLGRLQRWLWSQGIGAERVLVIGAGPLGQEVMRSIRQQPQLGYFLVGYLEDNPPPQDTPAQEDEPRYLGHTGDLPLLLEPCHIHEVIIALPSDAHQTTLEMANLCQQGGIDFRIAPDIYEMSFDQVDIAQLGGLPLIGLKEVAIRGWNLVLKRALDIGLSVCSLLLGWPLLLLIALLIKLDSSGPVFFRQKRVGRKGRPFTVLKFRTMHQHADTEKERLAALNEASGPLFKIRDDPRVTRVGRFLRRTSLDEIPQVFNVLLGEMSWVGPRPAIPSEVAQYQAWQRTRLEVLPGITGLWQSSGRSDLSFEEMVRLDIYYIENWSLWLDIVILLRTVPVVISGRGAY
ncbi:MAG: sugar transferase [Chloroflexia bacterium]|nr:sugar transferase [Chloroflexia bacterium]